MNAIAFSLYGSDPKYCQGMIKNAELAPVIYPGWKVVVFAEQVAGETIRKLSKLGCDIRPAIKGMTGLFWRFTINDDPDVERYIVRDADSRLAMRERRAVDAWIESDKKFHVIRDHPYHRQIVMGGLWGAKRGAIEGMGGLIKQHAARDNAYSSDQTFLANVIWPLVKDDCLQHDSCLSDYPGSVPLPDGLKMGDWRFCGEVFEANDTPQLDQWEKRINFMTP